MDVVAVSWKGSGILDAVLDIPAVGAKEFFKVASAKLVEKSVLGRDHWLN